MSTLVIHTRGDGRLGDTSVSEVSQIAAQVAERPRSVIHIHGGLVNKPSGLAKAQRLEAYYRAAGVLPVFFVWESGPWETIRNNWKEIFDEKLFQALLKRLLKHAGGKLLQSVGGREGNTYEPLTDREAELAVSDAREAAAGPRLEPLRDVVPVEPPTQLTADEERLLADELAESAEFQDALDAVILGMQVPPPPGGRAPAIPIRAAKSHLSPTICDELRDTAKPGARGLFDPVSLIKHAVTILARIVRRFIHKRDHGFYTTVVEETLRELYFDAVGGRLWGLMKEDTAGTFVEGTNVPSRGGAVFLRELAARLRERHAAGKPLPRLSLVAHSAGSIWACNFLLSLAALRDSGVLLADFRIDRLIFLAPACSCSLFTKALARHAAAPVFDDFRMFALSDPLEAGYWEAPPLYPRSLLYMVSGLFEDEVDEPLAGMERYATGAAVYNGSDAQTVRAFTTAPSQRSVWSCQDRGLGLASDAPKHGAFDDTDALRPMKTMQSVTHFLTH